MSGYEVDPVELFAAQARVVEAAQDGRDGVGQVRLSGADLFAGGWTGAAAAAFHEGFDEWLSGAASMLAGLEDLASALGAAARDYERSESTNTSTFTRMAS